MTLSLEDAQEYEWGKYYKLPGDTVIIDENHMDMYWYFIFERLKIYHKRVVLKEEAPWTEDEILQKYRFTNISRDMDKLTIWEINNILNMVDEPTDDIELRKKSILFNIFLYRMYTKIESYQQFGFIDFEDNAEEKYIAGKERLKAWRDEGNKPFTGSYMVNPMDLINPNIEQRKDKILNSYYVLDNIFYNIDEIYKNTISECPDMKVQIEYLVTLPGIGWFNAYEIACSIASISRYYNNPLVDWTQDNYSNIGPGSGRGIDAIFKDCGNLTKMEALIFLRANWEDYMTKLGYYEEFISMLPEVFDNDLDLRIIEHCLCEFSKYIKVKEQGKRTRALFKNATSDLGELEFNYKKK